MIRITLESETDTLLELAISTGVFKPLEIDALREVLDDYHDGNHQYHHKAFTYEENGRPIGFAYFAPIDMTDRSWILYWIFVGKEIQAKGVGTRLLTHVENELRLAGARIFLIETSALPSYEPTRRFYLKHGYEIAGTIRDFYSDGDDQVIFRKRISQAAID